jgi:hypothetical protein
MVRIRDREHECGNTIAIRLENPAFSQNAGSVFSHSEIVSDVQRRETKRSPRYFGDLLLGEAVVVCHHVGVGISEPAERSQVAGAYDPQRRLYSRPPARPCLANAMYPAISLSSRHME